MYIRTYVRMYVRTYVRTYVCMYVRTYGRDLLKVGFEPAKNSGWESSKKIRIGPNWDEYKRKRISGRTSLKDRKRTYVRKCTSDVRNHFLRPFYKRPEILSNRIVSKPNLGTFGLIRRKVVFFLLAVRTVVGANILDVR